MGKNLSDKQLMTLAAAEFIELTKQYRDGDENAFEKAKYPDILEKRGMKLSITTNFIHRIFQGEFDNTNMYEVNVMKPKES